MRFPKPSEDHFREDYLARERGQLFELWEGQRIHNTDFYKQILTLSVAGLGFNLTVDRPTSLAINFPPDAWGASIIGFSAAIIFTLLVFFLTAMNLAVQSIIFDRYAKHGILIARLGVILAWMRRIVAFLSIITFGIAMWMSISRFFP